LLSNKKTDLLRGRFGDAVFEIDVSWWRTQKRNNTMHA